MAIAEINVADLPGFNEQEASERQRRWPGHLARQAGRDAPPKEWSALATVALGMAATGDASAGVRLAAMARSIDEVGGGLSPLAWCKAIFQGRLDAHPEDLECLVALGLVAHAAGQPVPGRGTASEASE